MNDKSKQTSQKLRGGYYTPEKMADFIVHWLSNFNIESVLEPSAGDGVFIECLEQLNKNIEITAVEFLDEEADKITKISQSKQTSVLHKDFYKFYEEYENKILLGENAKFDAILGNPPYIRYQFLSDYQRDFQSDILKNNGLKPNKLVNSWMAFTVAAVEMLNRGGKIGFVLPTDLLQVSYAKQLREFLFEQLATLTIITFDEIVFEGIQQDVVILLGEKKSDNQKDLKDHQLRVINLKNLDDLKLEILKTPFDSYKAYSSDKWTKFYLNPIDRHFYENELFKGTISFNKYAKGEVGVTTGNNNYFVIDNETLIKNKLQKYGIPTLGRSVEVNGIFYNREDLEKNILIQQKVWMLDFNGKTIDSSELDYLKQGELTGITNAYKIRIRDRWFDVPSIWTPDVFLLRRIGEFPRIVKNEINATSTDTFHRIRVFEPEDIDKLIFLMHSSITLLSFELEGRVFGGGALEILPGDLKNIMLPLVDDTLDFSTLCLSLDKMLREKMTISQISEWVDKQLIGHIKFDESEILKIQKMLRSIRNRRIGK